MEANSMKVLLIIIIISFSLISCNSESEKLRPINIDTSKKKSVNVPGPMTDKFRDIDTTIKLALFNLSPYCKVLPNAEKIKLIRTAIYSALPDQESFYLNNNCWKYSITEGNYKDTIKKAPDCRLDEFHFIDLDNDGDLDIIYSSLVDQYVQWDGNFLMLLRNDRGNYLRFDIGGYLYDVDFSQFKKGEIIFKTASRPCCDYFYYNFYTTTFNCRSWARNTEHILEIKQSKVQEKL